jgi:hypothetical protein
MMAPLDQACNAVVRTLALLATSIAQHDQIGKGVRDANDGSRTTTVSARVQTKKKNKFVPDCESDAKDKNLFIQILPSANDDDDDDEGA